MIVLNKEWRYVEVSFIRTDGTHEILGEAKRKFSLTGLLFKVFLCNMLRSSLIIIQLPFNVFYALPGDQTPTDLVVNENRCLGQDVGLGSLLHSGVI